MAGPELNAPEAFIANTKQQNWQGFAIKVPARRDGSFTVTNLRNNFSKTYKRWSLGAVVMRRPLVSIALAVLLPLASLAQMPAAQIEGKEVFRNDDVVFHQIDEHTWVGTGHMMANESLYLVEGTEKAALIDAGTKITDLDKIAASITKKPIMLVATHAHPDHTGSAINDFPELSINPADAASPFVANYRGKIRELKDGEIIDLGGRALEVVFTPGHTPGSTTFLDRKSGYGFSGDSFGSGNLLLSGTFSTLLATCRKMSGLMEKYGITHLYPGHYFGKNVETKQRVDDIATISNDVLAGNVKGEPGGRGGSLVISACGVRINYGERSLK
jgi:hydroxyacylglutathione hydrolase